MNTILQFVWIIILYMFASRLLNRIMQIKAKMSSEEVNKSDELEKTESLAEEVQTQKEKVVEVVKDELCGVYTPKDKAYQLVDSQDKTHYFCSWECRQKYIEAHGGKNKS